MHCKTQNTHNHSQFSKAIHTQSENHNTGRATIFHNLAFNHNNS